MADSFELTLTELIDDYEWTVLTPEKLRQLLEFDARVVQVKVTNAPLYMCLIRHENKHPMLLGVPNGKLSDAIKAHSDKHVPIFRIGILKSATFLAPT